jgi:PAS domain S-box-containing protein
MGAVIAESSRCIVDATPKAESMFGYSLQELAGMPVDELLNHGLRDAGRRGFADALTMGKAEGELMAR